MEEAKIINYIMTKKYKDPDYLCWDFVQDVYKDMYGFDLPDYPVGEVPAEFKEKLKSNFKHDIIKKEDSKEGDIVVFSKFAEQHAGVMLNDNNFIHLTTTRVAVSQLDNLGGNYVIYRPYR